MTDIVKRLYEMADDITPELAAQTITQLRAEIAMLRVAVIAARREGIEAAAAIAANWNIPSVDKPAAIRALLKEPGRD